MQYEAAIQVSILCTVYNHEAYLRQCLDGFVMQQTRFRYEAIVHDDVSTDGSVAIIREYAEKYPDIIVPIYDTENQYSKHDGSLWRIMMEKAKGRYIAFCEGDDYWIDCGKLQRQFDLMEKHPEYTICFHRVGVVTVNDNPAKETCPRRYGTLWSKEEVTLYDYLKELCYNNNFTYQLSSYFIRRFYMEQYVSCQTSLFCDFPYGDVPMALSALFQGKGSCIQHVMSHYRELSGGYTSSMWMNLEKRLAIESKECLAYSRIDVYLNNKYHAIIKYRILRNELNEHSLYNKKKLVQFRPKYWCLLKFQSFRCNLSYFIKGLLQIIKSK